MAQVRQAVRMRQYSRRTEDADAGWIKRYTIGRIARPKGVKRLPVVLTDEVRRLVARLEGHAVLGGVTAVR